MDIINKHIIKNEEVTVGIYFNKISVKANILIAGKLDETYYCTSNYEEGGKWFGRLQRLDVCEVRSRVELFRNEQSFNVIRVYNN